MAIMCPVLVLQIQARSTTQHKHIDVVILQIARGQYTSQSSSSFQDPKSLQFSSRLIPKYFVKLFYRCTVHFEIYVVHSPTKALFINLLESFKFTLKYTIISLLHVSVFNDHHQGALSLPN